MAEPVGGLDHVGIVVPDLDKAAATYERLGFQLTGLARQSGPLVPGGPVVPWGSGNRCAMLRQGYIELIAVVERGLYDNGLDAFLARYAGIHILALGVADATAELARLRAAGLGVGGVRPMERPVGTPEGAKLARFRRVPLDAAPEGRIQLIEHETPELLWQEHLLDHPNRAKALVEVVLCVADLSAAEDRLSRLTGTVAEAHGPARIYALPKGRLVLCDKRSLAEFIPDAVPPTLPWFAGFSVVTEDANAAATRLLRSRAIRFREAEGRLMVAPEHACGAACVFVP